jgi:hypothetical protein
VVTPWETGPISRISYSSAVVEASSSSAQVLTSGTLIVFCEDLVVAYTGEQGLAG